MKWQDELLAASASRKSPVNARTYLRLGARPSYANPIRVLCDDNKEYAVKGMHSGRSIVNDHIVAWLGVALGAPVAKPQLVNVPIELINQQPEMAGFIPGLSHATEYIPDASDRWSFNYCEEPANEERFAYLAVLYGWCHANDQQAIYRNQPPRLVYSVDHGHFFPFGPNWRIDNLSNASPPVPDSIVVMGCGISNNLIQEAIDKLKQIDNMVIVKAIAAPPDEWGLHIDERAVLVDYFITRRDAFKLI